MRQFLIAMSLLLVSGCMSSDQQYSLTGGETLNPVEESANKLSSASDLAVDKVAAYISQEGDRLSQLKSSATVGSVSIGNSERLKQIFDTQLVLLSDIQSDEVTTSLIASGGSNLLRKKALEVVASIKTSKELLKSSLDEITTLREALDSQIQKAKEESDLQKLKTEKLIQSLKDENVKAQQKLFNYIAVACGAVAVALLLLKFTLGLPTGKVSIVVSIGTPVCLAISQMVGKDWFLPGTIAVSSVAFALLAIYLTRQKAKEEDAKLSSNELATLKAASSKVAVQLDSCYESTDTLGTVFGSEVSNVRVSDAIDELVFSKMFMTQAEKAQIHKLRMDLKASR